MQGKKFEQLDALRFFAILPVLTSHWNLLSISNSTEFLLSSNGVNLFFAISGFLITLGLIRSREKTEPIKTSLMKFYIKRFLRIFPIYYLMLFLLWFFNHKKVADGIFWYLSYSTNFYCIKIQDWGGLQNLWSLAIEEQFYIIWPFIILFASRKFLPFIIVTAIAISILIKIYWLNSGASFWTSYMNPFAVLDILGMGALLSYFFYFKPEYLKQLLYNNSFIVAVFAQLIIVLYFKYSERYISVYQVLNRISFGLFCFWLIGRSVFGFEGVFGKILNLKPLLYIGKISYSVYLLHILIPGMLMGIKYPTNSILRFGMYFILTILISSFSWYFFESKILKFKDKFE